MGSKISKNLVLKLFLGWSIALLGGSSPDQDTRPTPNAVDDATAIDERLHPEKVAELLHLARETFANEVENEVQEISPELRKKLEALGYIKDK